MIILSNYIIMTQEYPYSLDALKRDKKMMEEAFENQLHKILDAINARESQEKTLNKIIDKIKSNERSSPVTVTDIDGVNNVLDDMKKRAENHAKELNDKVQQLAFDRDRITLTINKLKNAIAEHPASKVPQGGKRMKRRKSTRKTKKQLPSPLPKSFGGKKRNRKTKIKLPLPLKFIGKKTRRKGRK